MQPEHLLVTIGFLFHFKNLRVALLQIIITIGFLIALMAVIGRHAPVDLGTFNPAGPAQLSISLHVG